VTEGLFLYTLHIITRVTLSPSERSVPASWRILYHYYPATLHHIPEDTKLPKSAQARWFSNGPKRWNHWSPNSKLDMSLRRWGYEPPPVESWSRVQEFPSLWDLNKHMTGNWVDADADMKQAVTFFKKTLEIDFFHSGIQVSRTQLDEVNGDYVKIWWVQSATHSSWIPRNWKTVFCITVLVQLIFENSLQMYTWQAALSRNFWSFPYKNAPYFSVPY